MLQGVFSITVLAVTLVPSDQLKEDRGDGNRAVIAQNSICEVGEFGHRIPNGEKDCVIL